MIPILHALFPAIAAKMPNADGEEVLATCLASEYNQHRSGPADRYTAGPCELSAHRAVDRAQRRPNHELPPWAAVPGGISDLLSYVEVDTHRCDLSKCSHHFAELAHADLIPKTSSRAHGARASLGSGALFGVALFLMSSCLEVAAGSDDLRATWQLWSPAVLLGLTLFVIDEALGFAAGRYGSQLPGYLAHCPTQ
eukprot:Skav211835  [mRNA]  locus=scaffold305:661547:663169:- [translate_table: standard]